MNLLSDLFMFQLFCYILCYEDWFNSLTYVLILYKQHVWWSKNLIVYIRSCLSAYIVSIKPFTMDLYSVISCIPIITNCFTKKCSCFQNHSDTFLFLKVPLSGPRQSLATESPLKIFPYKIFKFLFWLFVYVAKRRDKKDNVDFKCYDLMA